MLHRGGRDDGHAPPSRTRVYSLRRRCRSTTGCCCWRCSPGSAARSRSGCRSSRRRSTSPRRSSSRSSCCSAAFPAAVCMAIDGLLISVRRKNREPYRIIFNIAEPTISVLAASKRLLLLYGGPSAGVRRGPVAGGRGCCCPRRRWRAVYFLFNSGLTAIAVSSETGRSPYRVWREHFLWLSLNYFGGASVALLLALNWSSLQPQRPRRGRAAGGHLLAHLQVVDGPGRGREPAPRPS